MAKKDRVEDDGTETQDDQPKETAMAKKDDESKPVAASTEGLVKMVRGDKIIHAHPTTVHDHNKNGWKHA
jgi:hypothetical protein